MTTLDKIINTKRIVPVRTLIHGDHKIGKSTFASCADNPIFIDTEEGQSFIDSKAFPKCRSWQEILDCITSLYRDKHDFKTVIIDSVDWAERLAQADVAKDHNLKSIDEIGYGKGYTFAADKFSELLEGLSALRNHKNMAIILICHSEIRRFDDPMADSYDRYQIKLHKTVSKMIQEWVDVIGFCQNDTVTKTEDLGFNNKKTRSIDLNSRVLRLVGSSAYDAGNRFGLPDKIPLIYQNYKDELIKAGAMESNAQSSAIKEI